MVHPVTTTDLFLQEVAGLLTEIRDLLQDAKVETPAAKPAASSPAAGKAKQPRARATSKKS